MSHPASTDVASRDSFVAYSEAVQTLVDSLPNLFAALDGKRNIDDLPGWRSMRMRFQAFQDQGGQPIQVAMLFGPSGAGKSTVFRQLTGIDVPAGGEIRPMTFGCAVAAAGFVGKCRTLAAALSVLRTRGPHLARSA